jgi:hypothetical protein
MIISGAADAFVLDAAVAGVVACQCRSDEDRKLRPGQFRTGNSNIASVRLRSFCRCIEVRYRPC